MSAQMCPDKCHIFFPLRIFDLLFFLDFHLIHDVFTDLCPRQFESVSQVFCHFFKRLERSLAIIYRFISGSEIEGEPLLHVESPQ